MKNRIQWEYCQLNNNTIFFYRTQEKRVLSTTFEEQTKTIAQLGTDGWELVAVWGETHMQTWYFKRPV